MEEIYETIPNINSKKSLKIPKWQPESVNRRTDNTMAKRMNNYLQNIHTKLKIKYDNTNPTENRG